MTKAVIPKEYDYLRANMEDCIYYGFGFHSFVNFNQEAVENIGIETTKVLWQEVIDKMCR